MSTTESPTASGWKAGAKALAEFQAEHQGVAKGGKVDGGPRKGSTYATLTDILRVCALGATKGLSHSGQARLVGESLLVWREVLHHESGESIYTEHPIPVPTKGLPGQQQQDLGGCITYARKYCLQGLYGLFADDGLDPDSISYGDAGTSQSKPSRSSTPKASPEPPTEKAATAVAEAFSGEVVVDPSVVTVEKSEPSEDDPQRALTKSEVDLCKEIIKDKVRGAEWKADFMKRFYPSAESLKASMLQRKEHLDFLTLLRSEVPF